MKEKSLNKEQNPVVNKYIRKENQYSVRHMKIKAIITIALIISAVLMATKVSQELILSSSGKENISILTVW